jgi:hypothetical protein
VANFDAQFRAHYGYNQPATPLSAMGMIAAATGDTASKYVARPRNSALHPRELHPVHGLHLGVPGYRAAQLLAGSEYAALDRRLLLHRRSRRPRHADGRAAGDREARPPAHGSRDQDRHSSAHHPARSHRYGGRFLRRIQAAVLRHYRQGSHGLPEGERHLQFAGAQDRPARAASSPSLSAICARAAPPASPPAATTTRSGWWRKPKKSMPST